MPVEHQQFHYWDPRGDLEYQKRELPRFVRYNDPAVDGVRKRAKRTLSGLSGTGAFKGTVAGPVMVDREVRAVFEHLRLTHMPQLHYLDAHYLSRGGLQIIRSPGQIGLDEGGTCIDLVCLLAAVLYGLGHNPLVVVLDERADGNPNGEPCHAVLGYWRIRAFANDIALTHKDLESLAQDRHVGFVETTYCTAPDHGQQPRGSRTDKPFLSLDRIAEAVKDQGVQYQVRYAVCVRAAYELNPQLQPYGPGPAHPVEFRETVALFRNHGDTSIATRLERLHPDLVPPEDVVSEVTRILFELLDPWARRNGWSSGAFYPSALDHFERNGRIPRPLATRLRRVFALAPTDSPALLQKRRKEFLDVLGDVAFWRAHQPRI